MTRQDDKYETLQCNAFDLKHIGRRGSVYIPDAIILVDEIIRRIELKSCNKSRSSFSTSSRMGHDKLDQWEEGVDCYIFSIFENNTIQESYFLTRKHMDFFYKKVIEKQNNGHSGVAGFSKWLKIKSDLIQHCGYTEEELMPMEKQNKRGSRINDPGISVKQIKSHGIKIKDHNHLRQLVSEHCEASGMKPDEIDLLKPPKGFKTKNGVCPVLSQILKATQTQEEK